MNLDASEVFCLGTMLVPIIVSICCVLGFFLARGMCKNYEPREIAEDLGMLDVYEEKKDLFPVVDVKEDKKERSNRESFVKPTLDELRAYIFENGFSVDPERFLDYYDSNGWKVGKSRMKDWKKAVNNWQRNEKPKKDGMDYPKEGNGYLW